jgi:hypothetical protein
MKGRLNDAEMNLGTIHDLTSNWLWVAPAERRPPDMVSVPSNQRNGLEGGRLAPSHPLNVEF